METVGIICEYNPFHNGHARQFSQIRSLLGGDAAIVCVMSGDFVQRGQPAIYPKEVRAAAAVACGADLVLELPLNSCLSSAEGFASGGVSVLSRLGVVDRLAFGCENPELLGRNLPLLLSEGYQEALHLHVGEGLSYAAAGQKALETLGGDGVLLSRPNNILAVEYCKALARQSSRLEPLPLKREGDYHGLAPDPENPSAEFLRSREDWDGFVPEKALECYRGQPKYRMESGERAMLSRLRLLTREQTETLPYGSEGLWNKLLRAIREGRDLEGVIASAKSRRYPYTRISRMLLCACLGLTAEKMAETPDCIRVLAFSQKGRPLLRRISDEGTVPLLHVGQARPVTASDLFYPLFREEGRTAAADGG